MSSITDLNHRPTSATGACGRRTMLTLAGSGYALVSLIACLGAQSLEPKAELRSFVASDGVRVGTSVRVALEVQLPGGVHVQGNRPRDPLMIPTVLTIDAPTSVTIAEIVYPEATDFAQVGQTKPLAVFDQRFVIGATLTLDRTLAVGETIVPASLRYQACNASTCFAPARVETRWVLRVVPPNTPTPAQYGAIFDRIRFRR